MRTALVGVLLLWQLGSASSGGETAPQHLRYVRDVQLPPGAAGQACVVLDANVFAHAGTNAANDLRVYASGGGSANGSGRPIETPFAMTESSPLTAEVQAAAVLNAEVEGGRLVFDLAMPARAYTEVDLRLGAKDFLGEARVWGLGAQPRKPAGLGTFTIFDLSSRGLARSTRLALPESKFPMLHIELLLTDLAGRPLPNLSSAILQGADVPPSRTEQTLYTTVAATSNIDVQGLSSLATLTVPAHVPVERVRFILDPSFRANFLRDVLIAATPISRGYGIVGAAESVSGTVFRVTREAMPDGMPPIHAQRLFVDATLGSNLRSTATVLASVHNGSDTPLPIRQVELQMRQRRVCFEAARGASYTLRYGDAALRVPVYSYAQSFRPAAAPIAAELGPERVNPHFVPDRAPKPLEERDAGASWVLVLAGLVIAGVIVLQWVRQR